jgi:predicted MPP superfamily phosphohydrolase
MEERFANVDNKGRIMAFLITVLSVWTLMHVYVVSRLWNIPPVPSSSWHTGLVVAGVAGWLGFPLALFLSRTVGRAAAPLELAGSIWVGVLFLLLTCLLAIDLVTGFGWLATAWWRHARMVAVAVAGGLSVVALIQGLRPPEVREHVVTIGNLRPEHDGLRIVQLSDLHLGPFLRTRWLDGRVAQVEALRPDLVVVTGDLVDQDAALAESVAPPLGRLRARFGVWGVTGNHEFYAGLDRSLNTFDASGIRVLRDSATEIAAGLVLAGVDDLSARRQFGLDGDPVGRALANRPPGTTIFLCHSPWEVERAAGFGVDLMLSGHTHAGQIWPFTYLVRMAYPYVVGRFDVNGMSLIVSRGTGLWGPPMRLFRRSEITAITLRAR